MTRGTSIAVGAFVIATAAVAACSSLDGLAIAPEDDAGFEGGSEAASSADDSGVQPALDAASDADASSDPYVALVMADNPLGYWRFEETSGTTAVDSSGNGRHGTYGSTVVLGRPALAGNGHAVEIDGAPDAGAEHFILVPPHIGLQPTTAITVECWIEMIGDYSSANLVSYGSDEIAPFEPYVLYLGSGTPAFYVVANGTGVNALATGKISVGQKHHLAGVYDGTRVYLYVDGAEVASSMATGAISSYDAMNGLGIGNGASATRRAFRGFMDEVAIYGTALSAATISDHHVAGRAK